MAGRFYRNQFDTSYKGDEYQIEGFVSIGTGGQVNSLQQYVGTGSPSPGSPATGVPYGLLPNQATAGVPTGWAGAGGWSGTWGLYGAGVDGVGRVSTGVYCIQLSEGFVRLDSVQVELFGCGTGIPGAAASGATWSAQVLDHSVGFGNSLATGGMPTGPIVKGNLPKNMILISFVPGHFPASDLPLSSGFHLDMRLHDSLAGRSPQ